MHTACIVLLNVYILDIPDIFLISCFLVLRLSSCLYLVSPMVLLVSCMYSTIELYLYKV
jgi:hypothetical protein